MSGTSKMPLSLKLIIHKPSGRVVFAEAGKEVADFLFGLIHVPMGSVLGLLAPDSAVARCIDNVYRSADSLQAEYLKPVANMDLLLRPKLPPPAPAKPIKKTYYTCTCGGSNNYRADGFSGRQLANVTDRYGTKCPACGNDMRTAITYIGPGTETEGTMYMVMDDLTVTRTSALSSVELLRKFGGSSLESLEETTVDLGMEQGLELLRASFQSKTALTDIFIKGKEGSC